MDSEPYRERTSMRNRQPQTYHPLPLLAGCVDFTDLDALQCPLSQERDEFVRHDQYAALDRRLVQAARDRERHSLLLDEVLRDLLPKAFTCPPEQYEGLCRGVPDAQSLLRRSWRTPQRLSGISVSIEPGQTLWQQLQSASWHESYIIPEGRYMLKPDPSMAEKDILAALGDMINRPWYFFYVTNIFDTNSATFLLHIAHHGPDAPTELADHMLRYIDTLAELIALHDDLTGLKTHLQQDHHPSSPPSPDPTYAILKATPHFSFRDPTTERQACSIVQTFLYTAWTRSVTLLFHLVIGQQLRHGSSARWSRYLAVQGLERLEDLGNLGQGAPVYSAGLAPPWLCNWSLELLRRSRAALCLDFRTLLAHLSDLFPRALPRCDPSSGEACDGESPASCARFSAAAPEPQTAHAPGCGGREGGCGLVGWDEGSYMGVVGPRAVALGRGPARLAYVSASAATMAVSHVWAHGQGGRPETGINACLHERYVALAGRMGCDSYWIDAACIPSEAGLRREAIGQINQIFGQSRAVVICDRDLLEISLGEEEEDYEHDSSDIAWAAREIVSVLLVCDWNVRAWTLLEALRGSRATFVLCKGERTVRLVDVLRLVWRFGPVDLAVLIGSVQHLLPYAEGEDRKSVEEGAQLLSQRHASKSGDEVIIGGLLTMRQGSADARKFWQATEEVNTAFLVSSAPRVRDEAGQKVKGVGWAPATPIALPREREVQTGDGKVQAYSVRYPVYDGNGSHVGAIGSEGLRAVWSYMIFDRATIEEHRQEFGEIIDPFEAWGMEDADIIVENPDSVSLCNEAQSALDEGKEVRLIQPASIDGQGPYQAAKNRGDVSGPCAVMVTSVDGGGSWEWHDIYSQLDNVYWKWQRGEMLIV